MEMEFEPNKHNSRARDEFRARSIHHSDDLFDQNESPSGEKVDLSTGLPIDNSTSTGMEDLEVTEVGKEDALPPLARQEDEAEEDKAEKWLRAHDPKYGKPDDRLAA